MRETFFGRLEMRICGFLVLHTWKSNTHHFADDSVHVLQVISQFGMNLGTNPAGSACSKSIIQEMNCWTLSPSFCCPMERHQLPMRFHDRLRGIIAGEDVR